MTTRLQLEALEDRSAPSALGAMLPTLISNVQYDASQLQHMHGMMSVYYDLLRQDIAKGADDPGGAAENAYGAGTAFFAVQSLWSAGQKDVNVDRFVILAGLASGQFDEWDGPNIWHAWTTLGALDAQNNAAYAADLALFNATFPQGYEFPIPGIHGATTLALIYPGINDYVGAK